MSDQIIHQHGLTEIDVVKAQLKASKRELETLQGSRTWKIGKALMSILRIPYALLGRSPQPRPTIEVSSWSPSITGVVKFSGSNSHSVHIVMDLEHSDVADKEVYRSSCGETGFELKYPLAFHIPRLSAVQLRCSTGVVIRPPESLFDSSPNSLELAQKTLNETDLGNFQVENFSGKDVALLSTFRPIGRGIKPLLHYVNMLKQQDVRVILIDTSEEISPVDESSLRNQSDLYIRRKNVGWDFASWFSVISRLSDLEARAGRIFLLNDSNVGPLFDLSSIIRPNQTSESNDVWGITESLQISPHVQSYFLAFERAALDVKALTRFAEEFKFPTIKDDIITDGEVALTQFLLASSLRVGALIPYMDAARRFSEKVPDRLEFLRETSLQSGSESLNHLRSSDYEIAWIFTILNDISRHSFLNPTHTFWAEIYEMGSPFIKRELLQKNPTAIPGLHGMLSQVLLPSTFQEVLSELTLD